MDKELKAKMDREAGPEFAPLKEIVREFKITVEISDSSGKVIRTEEIDYGSRDDKQWLGKLTYWALSNGNTMNMKRK